MEKVLWSESSTKRNCKRLRYPNLVKRRSYQYSNVSYHLKRHEDDAVDLSVAWARRTADTQGNRRTRVNVFVSLYNLSDVVRRRIHATRESL